MSSLSIWTYYANNKRKVIPVTGIIVLSILGVSSAGALTQSFFDDAAQEFAFYEHYATIDSRHLTGLSTALIERWRAIPPSRWFTVPVPITVTLLSVAIVTWQLWRMDPVAIIERRD